MSVFEPTESSVVHSDARTSDRLVRQLARGWGLLVLGSGPAAVTECAEVVVPVEDDPVHLHT